MALANELPSRPIPSARGAASMSPHFLEQIGAESLLEPERTPADPLDSIRLGLENIQQRLTGTEIDPAAYAEPTPLLPDPLLASDNVAARIAPDGSIILVEDPPPDVVQTETGIVFQTQEKLHGIRKFLKRASRARGHRPTHLPKYMVRPGDRNNKTIEVAGKKVVAIQKKDGTMSGSSRINREAFTNMVFNREDADWLRTRTSPFVADTPEQDTTSAEDMTPDRMMDYDPSERLTGEEILPEALNW